MNKSGKEKIFLYTGGLFVVLVVTYLLAVKPAYRKHLEIQAKIEQKEMLLTRYKTLLEREDQIKERVKYIKKEFNDMDHALLTEAKPSLAASELQEILEHIIRKTHVSIKNIRNKSPLEKEAFYQIPIEMTVESTLRELKDIVYHIENSDKFLLVKELSVRMVKSGNPETLKTKLIIDGFVKNVAS